MGLRILFLTPRYPFPLIGGDRVKAYYLLRGLAASHEVVCASMIEGADASVEQREALTGMGVRVETVLLSQFKAVARVALTVLSNKPLEIQYYTSRNFAALVDRLVVETKPDVIISFFMRTAEYALPYRIPRVLVAEDARLLLQERATAGGFTGPGWVMRMAEKMKLRKYEPQIIGNFDRVTYVAELDRKKMQGMNPAARTAIVTNGVDLEAFPFNPDQSSRSGLVLAGKLDVLQSRVLAESLAREVMPLVRRQVPDAVCTIVGKNPPPAITRLACEYVRVIGEVPHMSPYLTSAAVFAHPLRVGAGIQNKVLEAMASGAPVVTTSEGISGIRAIDGEHAFVTRSTEEFANRSVALLRDASLRFRMATAAHALIERDHTWPAVLAQLQEVLDDVVPQSASRSRVIQEAVA
jgi:glycosyltransferase involved in cell wall biosynthesis